MALIEDLKTVLDTVLPADPSFRAVDRAVLDRHIEDARHHANAGALDDFILSLMRVLALAGNGHTRLIPNNAISVLPLRFVTIGSAVRLLDAPSGFAGSIGDELLSVNGISVSEIENAAGKFLAGTDQRKRVIGPILLVWPSALVRLGVVSGNETITYEFTDKKGRTRDVVADMGDRVRGSVLYPRNEHGKADPRWSPDIFLVCKDFGPLGTLIGLPSFFDPGEKAFADAIGEATRRVKQRPHATLLLDVRGNTGGDFLKTLPLIDAILDGAKDRKVGVLVDKFTFSAAIVFVAILKYRLAARLNVIGEEMGDGLTFFAEGGTQNLAVTGAVVRYSTALHDWATGRTDETTPSEIAKEIVPVGSLKVDRYWVAHDTHGDTMDRFYREVLDGLQS